MPGLPRVLIIERQAIVAADIYLQLTSLGYRVVGMLARPEEALKSIASQRPDIVITSVHSACGLRGRGLAWIIARQLDIPLVFVSGGADRRTRQTVVDVRPYAFIAKPFRREDLRRGMQVTVDRMRAEGLWPRLKRCPISAVAVHCQG